MSTQQRAAVAGKASRKAKAVTAPAVAAAAQQDRGSPFVVVVEDPTPGLYFRTLDGKARHVCGILRPLGECIDIRGRMAGVLVELVDSLGQLRTVVVPRDAMAPLRLHQFLINSGLPIPLSNDKDRGRLILLYLDSEALSRKHIVIDGDGWYIVSHPNQVEPVAVYAAGDVIYGPKLTSLVLCRRQSRPRPADVSAEGALTELFEVIADDPMAVFLICASAASVLLRPLRRSTSLLFLVGSSSIGKSTILRLCASLFGDSEMLTWHATKNGVNAAMRVFQDRVCVIDEVNQSTGAVFAEAAYDLTNDSSKLRATPLGDLAGTFRNVNVVLSAGEESPLALIRRSGRNVAAGQHARLLTVPVCETYGVWTHLGEFDNGAQKSAVVGRLATVSKGAFIARFAQVVVDQVRGLSDDFAQHAARLEKEIAQTVELRGDPVAHRVLKDFTVFLYAGLVARDDRVLPWSRRQILHSVRHAFALWHREYLRERPATADDAMLRLQLFFQSRRGNQFPPLTQHDQHHAGTVAGYEHTFKGEPDSCFLVLPAFFKQELCKGINPSTALNALKERALLRPGPRNSMTTQVHLPGTPGEHRTFYAVRRAILAA